MDAQQIADKIGHLIDTGAEGYRYNDRLLSVRDLGAQEGVSAQTASDAYRILSLRGQVRTSKKSGTRVNGSKVFTACLGTFSEAPDWNLSPHHTEDAGDVIEAKLFKVSVSQAEGLAEWGIPDGTPVTERHTVTTVNGAPVQHKVTVLPYDLAVKMPLDPDYTGVAPMMSPVGHPPIKQPLGINMSQWLGWDVDDYVTDITGTDMTQEAADVFGVPKGTRGIGTFCVAKKADGETVFLVATTMPLNSKLTITHK